MTKLQDNVKQTNKVRQGRRVPGMPAVLGISTVIAVIALATMSLFFT
jgi:hypothetical protein